MAETAAILSPAKRVLLPDLRAGCSLAATITAEDVRKWKAQFPGYIAVGYVNTTAEVKAELDYCCTSGNVLDVIDAIPEEQGHSLPARLLPGRARAADAAGPQRRGVDGRVPRAQAGIRPETLNAVAAGASRRRGAGASRVRLRRPADLCDGHGRHEARGPAHRLDRADDPAGARAAGQRSSSSPPRPASCTGCSRWTPGEAVLAADPEAVCAFMKTITLENMRDSLLLDRYHVTVPSRHRGAGTRGGGPDGGARPGRRPQAGRLTCRSCPPTCWSRMPANSPAGALAEDGARDVTTLVTTGPTVEAEASIEVRSDTVLAGSRYADAVLAACGLPSAFWQFHDGDRMLAGTHAGTLHGSLRAILLAERSLLNLLQRACGIATQTRRYVDAVAAHVGAHPPHPKDRARPEAVRRRRGSRRRRGAAPHRPVAVRHGEGQPLAGARGGAPDTARRAGPGEGTRRDGTVRGSGIAGAGRRGVRRRAPPGS